VEVAGSNPSLFAAQLFALHLRSRTLLRARWKRLVCGHAGQRGGEAEKTRCHLGLSFWSSCAAIGLSGEPGAGGEEDTSSMYRRMSIDIRQYGPCSNVCVEFIITCGDQ
jgi:hypothetical protein